MKAGVVLIGSTLHYEEASATRSARGGAGGMTLCGVDFVPRTSGVYVTRDRLRIARARKRRDFRGCPACVLRLARA